MSSLIINNLPQLLIGYICTYSEYSATGNATTTKPGRGFQDPKLAQVFSVNKTTYVNETTFVNIAMPAPTLPPDDYLDDNLQSSLRAGAIAGGILVASLLLIAVFCISRRRQHSQTLPEVSASIEPQQLQGCGVHELHDPRNVPELPSLPIELDGPVPEKRLIQ